MKGISDRLLQRYIASLPRKLARLRQSQQELSAGFDIADEEARYQAHRLAGAGASYGFPAISEAARAVELASVAELSARLDELIAVVEGVIQTASVPPEPSSVLVVDDASEVCDFIREALEPLAFEVHEAHTAKQAWQMLQNLDIEVLILDLILPDEDGSVLLSRLRSSLRHGNMPVVVLTGRSSQRSMRECVDLGIDHFLPKPVSPDLVVSAVQASMRRRREVLREARTDPLTGLANRAGFLDQLGRLVSLSQRSGLPLSLGIVDLDHFKEVNDTHGHGTGDEVLRGFAGLLKERLRASDVPGRWGGEEFVVAFANTAPAGARIALEKLRAEFRERAWGAAAVQVTFSAGVTSIDVDEEIESAMDRADQLLYAAKEAGRDRIFDALPERREQRIVLLEDDADVARLVRELLSAADVAVTHLHRPEQLLTGKLPRPDMLIIDWNLPHRSAREALRAVSEDRKFAGVPVIVLTSSNDEDMVETVFELGAQDYLQKPLRPKELVARVKRLLR